MYMQKKWRSSSLVVTILALGLLIYGCSGAPTAELIAEYNIESEEITWGTRISPNGEYLAFGKDDKGLFVYELLTGNLLWTKHEVSENGFAVDISADGEMVASGTQDGRVIIRDIETGKTIKTISTGNPDDIVYDIMFSPDSKLIAISGPDDGTQIWDIQANEKIATLAGFGQRFWSSDSQLFGFGCYYDITIWNVVTAEKTQVVEQPDFNSDYLSSFIPYLCEPVYISEQEILMVEFLYDSTHLTIRNGLENEILDEIETETNILVASWSPDGKFLAIGLEDGTILLWSNAESEIIIEFQDRHLEIVGLTWSYDNSILLVEYWPDVYQIWSVKT